MATAIRFQEAVKYCAQQAADDWLCELCDLTRKCEFAQDCCANCEPTRTLGQIVSGVYNDEVRVKLLERGATLTLDKALTLLCTAEASRMQSKNLKDGDATGIQGMLSYKKGRQQPSTQSRDKFKSYKSSTPGAMLPREVNTGCWNCGAQTRCIPLQSCPAQGKDCNNCGPLNRFAKVCWNPAATTKQQGIHVVAAQPTMGAEINYDPNEAAIMSTLPNTGALGCSALGCSTPQSSGRTTANRPKNLTQRSTCYWSSSSQYYRRKASRRWACSQLVIHTLA